ERTEQAIKTVNILKIFLVSVLFGSMCVGFVIALKLTDMIVSPLQQLKRASEEIASGNLGYRVDLKDETEIGLLAETFNRMSETLKKERDKVLGYMSRLKGLHRITLSLHMITNRKDLIEEFVEGLYDVISTEAIYIYLLDESENSFRLVYKAISERTKVVLPDSCTKDNVLYLYNESNKRANLLKGDDGQMRNCFKVMDGIENALVLWLRQRERLLGFVLFVNIGEEETVEENIRVLSIIGNNFVVALENIQLYDDLRAQMNELRQTQEQLLQAAKLAAIGELAAIVAHELNNPLTTILGYTELLKEEEVSDTIKKDLDIIESESLRARNIVRQLLEFSRKKPLQLEETDIN
ncbi:MAG: HAMP domain-containing protein, partial [Nitrospirae bacterium]